MLMIVIAIMLYLVANLMMAARRQDAAGLMALLAACWAVAASWTTVTALRGDIDTSTWTARSAHAVATAYLPLIVLGLGLAIGDVLASLTPNFERGTHDGRPVQRKNINLTTMHENQFFRGVLIVLPILAVIGTIIAYGISRGLIQPVDGLQASTLHDFGITHNVTNLDNGWPAFQLEVRTAFTHTVFGAVAVTLSLLALLCGGTFGFVTGKFIRRRSL